MNNIATITPISQAAKATQTEPPTRDTQLTVPFSADIMRLAYHVADEMQLDVKVIHEVLVATTNFLCTDGGIEALERAKTRLAEGDDTLNEDDRSPLIVDNPDLLQTPEEAYEEGYRIGYQTGHREAMEEMGRGEMGMAVWQDNGYDEEDYDDGYDDYDEKGYDDEY